jgi:hypothetical protein
MEQQPEVAKQLVQRIEVVSEDQVTDVRTLVTLEMRFQLVFKFEL